MSTTETRLDGWVNVLTGLGMQGRDKRMGAVPDVNIMSQGELDALYRTDDIAQKIVNRIPNEFFRTGYEITVQDNDDAARAIKKYLDSLQADALCTKASKLARHYGGAAIILGIEDGRTSDQPVDLQGIRTVRWATVLDRYQLQPREIQNDLTKPDYGFPLLYQITSRHGTAQQHMVHASRLIRFEGLEIPEAAFISNNYWGDSVLLSVFGQLRNFSTAHDAVATLLQDFNQTVFELDNLSDLISSGDDALLIKRLSLIDAARSIVRAIVIQKGEGFRRESSNLTGVSDAVRLTANRLVAAADMPHTIILGEGSQGNTSGRSEEIDFYNLVAQLQESYLKPRQMKLIEYINAALDGPRVELENINISYKPLWEMDEAEQATIYKTRAEGDAIYITHGVVDPDEVAKSRFGDPESELTIEKETREALELPAPGTPDLAPDATIQDLAMNGAQVSSLLEIVTSVTAGTLPKASAEAVIRSAFPSIAPAIVEAILGPIVPGSAPAPAPMPGGFR